MYIDKEYADDNGNVADVFAIVVTQEEYDYIADAIHELMENRVRRDGPLDEEERRPVQAWFNKLQEIDKVLQTGEEQA